MEVKGCGVVLSEVSYVRIEYATGEEARFDAGTLSSNGPHCGDKDSYTQRYCIECARKLGIIW